MDFLFLIKSSGPFCLSVRIFIWWPRLWMSHEFCILFLVLFIFSSHSVLEASALKKWFSFFNGLNWVSIIPFIFMPIQTSREWGPLNYQEKPRETCELVAEWFGDFFIFFILIFFFVNFRYIYKYMCKYISIYIDTYINRHA